MHNARPMQRLPRAAVAAVVVAVAACNSPVQPERYAPAPGAPAFEVEIHQPARLTSVVVGWEETLDGSRQEVRVACRTCHSLREGERVPESPDDLQEFHRGLIFAHGELRCAACHVAGHHDQLRLADGRTIPMVDVMTLCGQCHGTQMRDYRHGAHGGMTGHWDLSRGPRLRLNCVDCHDPHAPAYPGGEPVFSPRDRFLPGAPGG
jgi:hypothetical protein